MVHLSDPLAAERARSDAWHEEQTAIAACIGPLEHEAARRLAFALVLELISQLAGAPIGALYSERMATVVSQAKAMRDALHAQDVPSALADVHGIADWLHARLNAAVGVRGVWPPELRIPAECAHAIRLACESDVVRVLPLLYSLAHDVLTRAAMHPERLAAHVAGGANAIQMGAVHPAACGCSDCDTFADDLAGRAHRGAFTGGSDR